MPYLINTESFVVLKLQAGLEHGCMQGRQAHVGRTAGIECWEEADASSFLVRGCDYPQTRNKVPSAPAIYRRALRFGLFVGCWRVCRVLSLGCLTFASVTA